MILVMWAGLGALAGVAVLIGVWAVRTIASDIREERADRALQVHHEEYREVMPSAADGQQRDSEATEHGLLVAGRRGQPRDNAGDGTGLAGCHLDRSPTWPPPPGPTQTSPAGTANAQRRPQTVARGGQHRATAHATATRALGTRPGTTSSPAPAAPVAPAGAGLPASVEAALAPLRAAVAALTRPTDEERWPHLAAGQYSDDTGSFERIVAGA